MKSFPVFLIFYCCAGLVSAQQFSFKVITKGFSETDIVYLKKYQGKEEIIVDSVRGNQNTHFKVNSAHPVIGLYFITASKNESAEFIINPAEKIIVEIEKNSLKSGALSITGSVENEAYEKFVAAYLAYDSSFYRNAAAKFDEFDAKFISKHKAKSENLMKVQQDLNDFVTKLEKEYTNTYTANTLSALVNLPVLSSTNAYDNYPAFLFRHFWDNAELNSPELLNHFLLNEQLKNYFRHFVPKNQDSIKVAIDVLQSKASGNAEILNYINSFLLRNFLKSNAEDLALYVNSKNSESCNLNLSPAEMKKFETLKSLSIGSIVPEVLLPDVSNKKISLKELAEKNKATIVLFWSSHCGKCRAELPFIQQLYNKYHNSGLEVYAINLDENKFNWRDAIKEFNLDWINVTDEGKLADSKVLEQFNIQHTPSVFILDSSTTILAKEIYGKALQKKIELLLDVNVK